MEMSKEKNLSQSAPSADLTSIPMDFYKEICTNIRATDDISFKLLGIVPTLSGIGAGTLTLLERNQSLKAHSDSAVIVFSVLGLLIAFGLFKWELWNIKKCRWLIARAANFERRFTQPEKADKEKIQWVGWEDEQNSIEMYSIFDRPWAKTQAEKFIYGVAIAAWFVPVMIVLFKIWTRS